MRKLSQKSVAALWRQAKNVPLITTLVLLCLYCIPATVFVGLAKEVHEGEIFFFDKPVMEHVHSIASPELTAFFRIVTETGGILIVPGCTIAVAFWLYFITHRRKVGLFLLLGVGGAAILNILLKSVFQRSRPDFLQHLVIETGYSFPSGHAMGSAALAVCLVVMCWRTKWRWPATVLGCVYVLLVGLSRIYLGVHYPSDIVAGWALSTVWVLLVAAVLYEYREFRLHR